uniref:Family with sequence similarity 228 member A n=1 Tax=Vombatus ursinus TaxID=29139 RepID=A0A4X2KJ49_VOMUR
MLCRENYIIKELDKYLQRQDFLNERRKEMLHKRWVENVACPLQQKIIDKVSSPKEMEKRKRLEPDGYWRFRNSKVLSSGSAPGGTAVPILWGAVPEAGAQSMDVNPQFLCSFSGVQIGQETISHLSGAQAGVGLSARPWCCLP